MEYIFSQIREKILHTDDIYNTTNSQFTRRRHQTTPAGFSQVTIFFVREQSRIPATENG